MATYPFHQKYQSRSIITAEQGPKLNRPYTLKNMDERSSLAKFQEEIYPGDTAISVTREHRSVAASIQTSQALSTTSNPML